MIKRYSFYFLITFTFITQLHATITLSSRRISTADGLVGNTVNEMIQDSDGYIWMATNNGLSRYDGYSTVNYTSLASDEDHRLDARIGRIFHDSIRSLLWMSTSTYQNACYDLQRKRFIDWSGNGHQYRQQNKLVLTAKGMVLYGMQTGATLCGMTDGQSWTLNFNSKQKTLPSDNVLSVIEDSAHNIWLNTDMGFAVLRADQSRQKPEILKAGRKEFGVVAAAASGEATYLLTTDGTVYGYDTRLKKILNVKMPAALGHPSKVNTSFVWQGRWMLFTPEGTYTLNIEDGSFERPAQWQIVNGLNQWSIPGYHFIGTHQGQLWIFPDKGKSHHYNLIPASRLTSNKGWIFHIADDHQGHLFIATYGAGLYVCHTDDGSLSHFCASDSNPIIFSDYLLCAIADRQGGIWIGSENGGAYYLKATDNETARYLLPQPAIIGGNENAIRKLTINKDKNIIIKTREGKNYQTDTKIFAPILLPAQTDDSIRCQITDRHGRIWTGTYGHGIWSEGKQYMADDLNGSRIRDMELTADGTLWVASNNGIYRWNGKTFDIYNTQNGKFLHDEIHDLCCDKQQNLWAATAGGGLIKCLLSDNGEIEKTMIITTQEGLSNNCVKSLILDKEGYLWAGTEDGVSRIDTKSSIVNSYRFSATPQGNVFSECCAAITKDGHVLFGTADGLLIINPAWLQQAANTLQQNKATITDIYIEGVSQVERLAAGPIKLRYDENSLEFHFSNFNYNHRQLTVYQYYLEGYDQQWQNSTTNHQASYSYLVPGQYIFHLRSLGPDGQWLEETTLPFVISQPWWNTWWAWLLYLLIAGAVAGYVYRNWRERFRLHQQMKMEQQMTEMRTNLFTSITHEFRTPLAIIQGAVNKLRIDSGNRAALQTAQRGTTRLLRLVNQFMEYRKISSGNLRIAVEQADIVAHVKTIVQDFWTISHQKDINLSFIPAEKKCIIPFDTQLVESIIYNLLSNAIKYTPERGSVIVRMKQADKHIVIEVEDNGPGISKQQQQQLFKPFMHGYVSQGGMGIGLYTAHQIAAAHKGSLRYSRVSEEGGSCFTLTLPADDSPYTAEDYRTVSNAIVAPAENNKEAGIIRELQAEAFNNLTVAIIEDNPDMMEQIRTEVGVYFKTASYMTGQAGLEGIADKCPELLICDVMLPDIDGYEIVKQIKSNPETAALPIIMLTALDDETHQIRAYRAGADDYMVKPCNFNLLIARAMQLIKWNQMNKQQVLTSQEKEQPKPADITLIESKADKLFKEKLEVLTARHLADSSFTVDVLAQMMSMGRTKFYGKVKELTGMSPNKYLQEMRMQKAADLLADGELSVSEVCYKVGLQDPSYFNKCFKAKYGVTPSKYIEKV